MGKISRITDGRGVGHSPSPRGRWACKEVAPGCAKTCRSEFGDSARCTLSSMGKLLRGQLSFSFARAKTKMTGARTSKGRSEKAARITAPDRPLRLPDISHIHGIGDSARASTKKVNPGTSSPQLGSHPAKRSGGSFAPPLSTAAGPRFSRCCAAIRAAIEIFLNVET